MRKIKSLKIDKLRTRRPLSPEELEKLRDGCQTYKEKALVEFLVSSGCRLGEVVGIRTAAVDWQSRSILRHTFASNALNGGMDITVIQHLPGHTDPKTTLIYAELAPRTIKYEYERVVA